MQTVAIYDIISSYLLFVYDDGRRVSGVPLNYSITGHACATSAHAAVHSIPMPQKSNIFCGIEYGIQTLAVLKCPCHGIILDGTP